MKTKVLYSIMLLCIIGMSSCDDGSDERTSVSNSEEELVVVNQLSFLNDSLMSTREKTRGFIQPGWARRGTIIASDIGAAVAGGRTGYGIGGWFGPQTAIACATIGALVCGACGSLTAYEETDALYVKSVQLKEKTVSAYEISLKSNTNFSEYTPKEIVVDYPTKDLNITQLGAKHNYILKLIRDSSTGLDNNINYLSTEERYVLESEEYNSTVENVLQQITYNSLNGLPMQFKGFDVTTKVMNLFYELLVQYPIKINDIQFIINKYIEVVKASTEIDANDKNAIYMGLSVAASSTEYWEEELSPILEKK